MRKYLFIVLSLLDLILLAILLNIIHSQNKLNKKIESYMQKDKHYQMIIYKSEYYTKMSQIIWGKEARRCDAGLVIKVQKYIQEIDSTLDLDLVLSLITIESGFNTFAESRAGAIGLMQVLPSTARMIDSSITSKDFLYNEDVNLKIGIKYISDLIKLFEGNQELALLAYNRGPFRVKKEILSENLPLRYLNQIKKYQGVNQ